MCRTLWPAHPGGCFHLSLSLFPPTLFNVCHLSDSRGAAPVCLLARSPQIPPPAPACHSCCRASWDGGSEGRREEWWRAGLHVVEGIAGGLEGVREYEQRYRHRERAGGYSFKSKSTPHRTDLTSVEFVSLMF